MDYPHAPRLDLVEDLHGHAVADPYRWLEDLQSPEAQQWMDAQNAVTASWLAAVPERDELRDRLRALWDFPRSSVPWRRGAKWFRLRNSGLQDQDVLWVSDSAEADGAVLLDPNEWSADGTAALTGAAVSHDGALLAYAVSEQGSDWKSWRVRDIETGEDLADCLQWSKFSPCAWHPDGSGFWYGAYDPPDANREYQAATRGQRLFFHRLGTLQDEDVAVAEVSGEPEWIFDPEVTDDGRWLVITLRKGTDPRSRVWVADLAHEGAMRPLLDAFDADYQLVGNDGTTLYFLTDLDAPRGRVVAVDATDAARCREVIGESAETLERCLIVSGRLVTLWLADAVSRMKLYDLSGRPQRELDLPGLGSVASAAGRADDSSLFFSFVSFAEPPSVYRYDFADGAATRVFAPETAAASAHIVTEQVFVESTDGEQVPMFLIHREDVEPGQQRPALLWGYGGFNISVTPMFRVPWFVWVERGNVLAVPNLRGGGEYGQQWHDQGRLANKQQVFDDAISCAQWLVDHDWTRPERLAVQGGSNGGLMAAACLVQRPELFGAVVVEVGVLDMLRFHLSTIGWAWKSDYGDPDDAGDFEVLRSYSPLHNIESGRSYPPTLITSGDHDDRVVPSHSLKFAAALQAAQAGPDPVLLRIDRSGGHGAGKPTAKAIDERADVLAFLSRTLGADL